ncbi:hypothetical protein GYMLUDRAFT_155039 [Collybiopsis luxurians FD-317 M1]|nr:hypothetical protein GYMLUDRAFT_155039 [Collybiopsis luxurians FD-317 M1]
MQKEGLLLDKENRAKIHAKRCRDIMKVKRKELAKIHHCSPVTTALIPIVPQVPLFVLMTMTFARLAADPTSPFDTESFLTLSTLNHPDPTFTLPVVLGLITMANVESSHWVLSPEEKAALKESEKNMAVNVEKSGDKWTKVKLNLRSRLKDSMRILSILRIGLASIAPGAVTLYWVTSAIFGLAQTWLVNRIEVKRRRKLIASTPPISLAALQAITKTTPVHLEPSTPSGSASAMASLSKESTPRKDKQTSRT